MNASPKPNSWRNTPLPYVVLALSMTATLFISGYMATTKHTRDQLRFENSVSRLEDAVQNRLALYIASLRAGSGLYAASFFVQRQEFSRFVERLDPHRLYPGILGMGFSQRILLPNKQGAIGGFRRDISPAFHIWPEGSRAEYYSVLYLEPSDERNRTVIGYDMATDPIYRSAMENARDSGTPSISGRSALFPSANASERGFYIFVPIYHGEPASIESRRADLQGFIFAPCRPDDLMKSIYATGEDQEIHLELFDGISAKPENLLYAGDNLNSQKPRLQVTRVLQILGHQWTLRCSSLPGWDEHTPFAPVVLMLGTLVSLLLFAIMWYQSRARWLAEQTAEEVRRSDQALRLSEIRFRNLVEQSPLGIQVMSPDGRILRTNEAWKTLFGIDPETLAEYNVLEDSHLAETGILPYLKKAFAGETVTMPPISYSPARGDFRGQDRWVRAVAYPIKSEDGKVLEVVLIHEDITERKKAEDAARHSRDELELRVRERTAELSEASKALETQMEERLHMEQELFQSRKLEAVGRLAGGVAHDFNNLMTGINGLCEDLRTSTQLPPEAAADLAEIAYAANRASALTKQLLAFGRRQVTAPTLMSLNTAISDMQKMLRRLIGEDIDLVSVLDPALGLIKADPVQIEQILINLVINSRDAMPSGGVIQVETRNVDLDQAYTRRHFDIAAGPYVLLSVSDTGAGMDRETQAHAFEPFYTTKDKDKGTGLGLATVYGIVKQNLGDIVLASKEGVGTSFSIYLPRVAGTLAAEIKPNQAEPAMGGTETILVVEDEEIVRRVATRALKGQGYRVLEARNGQEALDLCRRTTDQIDLILTDVIMPGINGRQLAESLAALKKDIRILYMSGYPENVIVDRGILKPGISFIEKSFTSQSLCIKVREVLNGPPGVSL